MLNGISLESIFEIQLNDTHVAHAQPCSALHSDFHEFIFFLFFFPIRMISTFLLPMTRVVLFNISQVGRIFSKN